MADHEHVFDVEEGRWDGGVWMSCGICGQRATESVSLTDTEAEPVAEEPEAEEPAEETAEPEVE